MFNKIINWLDVAASSTFKWKFGGEKNRHNFLPTVSVVYNIQWSNMSELLVLARSSTAMRPKPVWVAMLGYSTVHSV
jgi:hypothetical protein